MSKACIIFNKLIKMTVKGKPMESIGKDVTADLLKLSHNPALSQELT